MNRVTRRTQATDTLAILQEGRYRSPAGDDVSIAEELRHSIANTRVVTPEEWGVIKTQALSCPLHRAPATIQVTGETTLAVSRRLVYEEGRERVMVLNFASAKNPGGGFLGGSQAQEESLARSSGLYACLRAGGRLYSENRRQASKLYTDHAILSLGVPVFRGDDGALLMHPYCVGIISIPAVNAGAIPADHPDRHLIEETMARRIEYVCAAAVQTGHPHLILGAWGCGVFRNDPRMVAKLFRDALFGLNRWSRRLRLVVFAVFDKPPNRTLRAFENALGGG